MATLLLLTAVLPAMTALGAPPRTLGRDVVTASNLSDSQRRRVEDYASYYTSMLATGGTPEDVQKARESLIDPLDFLNNPSAAFRFDYGQAVLDQLEDGGVLASDPHRAVNAILVISQLGTESALEFLLVNADIKDQPAPYIRSRAVLGCRHILASAVAPGTQTPLSPRKIKSALDEIRFAAQREQDIIILRHQLDTLLAVDRAEARDALVKALSSVIDRIESMPGEQPSSLIEPSTRAVALLRNAYVNLSESEKIAIGTDMGPSLGQLLETIEGHWKQAQNEATAKQAYGQAVDVCEDFLKRIHAEVSNGRGMPTAQLKEAWDKGEKPTYDQGVSLWIEQLSMKPYAQR